MPRHIRSFTIINHLTAVVESIFFFRIISLVKVLNQGENTRKLPNAGLPVSGVPGHARVNVSTFKKWLVYIINPSRFSKACLVISLASSGDS